ncbi:hypothetical protein SUGI_1521430 [Cryptomeria japonica]|uniref:F-box/LRR-repeat protein 15/At3g58940/PEG3-like LRR domain-containing protein n=1 Tax=Cryptomeria japonica TaxID=3369 RepID=A0AAD3RSC4_CRYJA|nr:hypothetical protein SUGI_1521430 [Cryptomeria japonica]
MAAQDICSQWRYHWTRIPHLHFSPHFFTHMRRSVRRHRILGREAITHIKETMEHILINHKAPLECFLLYIPNKFFRNGLSRRFIEALDIKECIDTVAQKGVERMFLEAVAHPWQKKVSLPITIFGCKTLLYLQLVGFIFPEVPILVENFKLLRVCVLANIQNLTEHSLQRLVELCPVLEKLVLRVGSVEGQSIRSFSDVQSLRKLSLEGLKNFPEVKFVGIFPGLEELNVSPRMMGTAVERGNELDEKVRDLMFPKLNNVYMDLPYLETEDELTWNLSYNERKDVLARLEKRICGNKHIE